MSARRASPPSSSPALVVSPPTREWLDGLKVGDWVIIDCGWRTAEMLGGAEAPDRSARFQLDRVLARTVHHLHVRGGRYKVTSGLRTVERLGSLPSLDLRMLPCEGTPLRSAVRYDRLVKLGESTWGKASDEMVARAYRLLIEAIPSLHDPVEDAPWLLAGPEPVAAPPALAASAPTVPATTHVVMIGWLGSRRAYIGETRENAVRRYLATEGLAALEDEPIVEFDIADGEMWVYDASDGRSA